MMTKARVKTGKKRSKLASAAGRGTRKPVDLDEVRQRICDLVGGQALGMVEITIDEVDKGHYGAMKYLFELIGLFPASGEEVAPPEDSLAKTLLRRLGVPEEPAEDLVTKECVTADVVAVAAGADAVK